MTLYQLGIGQVLRNVAPPLRCHFCGSRNGMLYVFRTDNPEPPVHLAVCGHHFELIRVGVAEFMDRLG